MPKKIDDQFDESTKDWLNSQKKSTLRTYKTYWRYFVEFAGLTGDQILERRKADKEHTWEKKVIEFKQWLIDKGQSENSATTATSIIRGFFSFHRLELEFRRSEKMRLKEAKRKYEDYRFSLEDFQKMYNVADLEERYVVTAGKSFGLRAGDFLALTRGDVEPYIDREVPISIGEYATQKEAIPAYPFVDSDAQPVIKLMIEKMDREGRTKAEDRILKFRNKIQLTRVLKRLIEKAGITTGTKRVRFHCLRKFLIDHISSFMSESKWKQIVGKKISEGAYVSPDTLRDDYTRAMAETCFSKRIGERDIQQMAKKEALLAIAKTMGITDRQLRRIFIMRRAKHIKDEIEAIEEAIKQRRSGQTNEADCQKIVEEQDLEPYLENGWQVQAVLPSGRVVIER